MIPARARVFLSQAMISNVSGFIVIYRQDGLNDYGTRNLKSSFSSLLYGCY